MCTPPGSCSPQNLHASSGAVAAGATSDAAAATSAGVFLTSGAFAAGLATAPRTSSNSMIGMPRSWACVTEASESTGSLLVFACFITISASVSISAET